MADAQTPQKRYDDLKAEIQMLDSKISLIAQKIRMIEKNEDIIGRTIVVHNGKLQKLESGGAGQSAGPSAGGEPQSGLASEVEALKKQVAELQQQAATKAEVAELHYTLDTINPLDFVTLKQARKLINEEIDKRSG